MKLNQYPTVETFVRIAKLNEAEKAALLIGCAKSLQKMHENGIIHRDIKESNLYIDIDGIKIGDFGTAQVEGKEDKVKRYFERPGAIGTDRYKAPEIERDNLFHIPGEVYAFGIMMYRIFEGKHPFAAKENEEILKWHREGVVPKTTSTVSKIIERCLEKDHRQRPSSIGLIGDEIANLFEKTGIKIPKI
jgi:serine/threonine-protein kinase